MASAHTAAVAPMREWKWSPQEKAVPRQAFDLARRRELENVMREAKIEPRGSRKPQACGNWNAGWVSAAASSMVLSTIATPSCPASSPGCSAQARSAKTI